LRLANPAANAVADPPRPSIVTDLITASLEVDDHRNWNTSEADERPAAIVPEIPERE
jgi:hypothetical protein